MHLKGGGAAGSGTVTTSGSPVADDWAVFTDPDTITGKDNDEARAKLAVTPTSVSSSRDVATTDANTIIKVTATADLTIEPFATVAIPVGTVIKFFKTTANDVGIVKGSDGGTVTFTGPLGDNSVDIDGTYAYVTAYHESTDNWVITGAVKAA